MAGKYKPWKNAMSVQAAVNEGATKKATKKDQTSSDDDSVSANLYSPKLVFFRPSRR